MRVFWCWAPAENPMRPARLRTRWPQPRLRWRNGHQNQLLLPRPLQHPPAPTAVGLTALRRPPPHRCMRARQRILLIRRQTGETGGILRPPQHQVHVPTVPLHLHLRPRTDPAPLPLPRTVVNSSHRAERHRGKAPRTVAVLPSISRGVTLKQLPLAAGGALPNLTAMLSR